MRRVLVIVVAYNGMRWLERCLSSVQTASGPDAAVSADVFVVDNDSTDGSADFVAAHFPKARLVRSAENLGFSKANNLGLEWALRKGYDYVYLLNQDAWLEEGALEKLVAAAEAHPDYAVLSPLQMTGGCKALDAQFAKILGGTKGIHLRDRRFATPPTSWAPPSHDAEGGTGPGGVCPSCPCTETPESVHEMAENSGPCTETPESVHGGRVMEIRRVMAAHWLVPAAAVQALGMLDEELFPFYGQDDDWCQRARYAGWKVGVVPEARAVHDRAARKEPLERTVFRNYYTGSLVRLADTNRPLWERFSFVCLFTLVKAFKYRSLLPFKYFRQICRQLPAVRKHREAIVARGKRAR